MMTKSTELVLLNASLVELSMKLVPYDHILHLIHIQGVDDHMKG